MSITEWRPSVRGSFSFSQLSKYAARYAPNGGRLRACGQRAKRCARTENENGVTHISHAAASNASKARATGRCAELLKEVDPSSRQSS